MYFSLGSSRSCSPPYALPYFEPNFVLYVNWNASQPCFFAWFLIRNKFVSLKEDDVTEIGINRSIELIEENLKSKKEMNIGEHPITKKSIVQKKGIKGRPDYISYNKKNYSIPENLKEEQISLKDTLKIINEKTEKKKETIKKN